ncbi:hypothetical protein BTVI_137793 [Pitangus sulphuratus]|nr:hypothetical protein BTVI_137793 [Pitangus sulphuratus]
MTRYRRVLLQIMLKDFNHDHEKKLAVTLYYAVSNTTPYQPKQPSASQARRSTLQNQMTDVTPESLSDMRGQREQVATGFEENQKEALKFPRCSVTSVSVLATWHYRINKSPKLSALNPVLSQVVLNLILAFRALGKTEQEESHRMLKQTKFGFTNSVTEERALVNEGRDIGLLFVFRPAFTLDSLALRKRKGWEGDRQSWARPLPLPLVSVGVAAAVEEEKEEKSAEERER